MKAMGPLTDMMLLVNDATDVVKLVEKLEGRMGAGRPVAIGPGTFKVLERMYVPDDYEEVLAEFMKDSTPATAATFSATVMRVVKRRNWTWLLKHPELKDSDVHTTRRMDPYPVCCVSSCGSGVTCILLFMRRYAKMCCSGCDQIIQWRFCRTVPSTSDVETQNALVSVVGTLLEVPALEAALTKVDHAFVPLASTRWKWREDDQWPPLTAVLAAPLFKLDQYEALRGRLRQRAPTQAGHPSTCP